MKPFSQQEGEAKVCFPYLDLMELASVFILLKEESGKSPRETDMPKRKGFLMLTLEILQEDQLVGKPCFFCHLSGRRTFLSVFPGDRQKLVWEKNLKKEWIHVYVQVNP